MHSGGPLGGIRVVCLSAGGARPPALDALLESADGLDYLGDCDMALAPFERVLALKPHVVILRLPLPALDVLRWINFLRSAFDRCGILVTAPLADPEYRRRVLAAGADDFVAAAEFEQRMRATLAVGSPLLGGFEFHDLTGFEDGFDLFGGKRDDLLLSEAWALDDLIGALLDQLLIRRPRVESPYSHPQGFERAIRQRGCIAVGSDGMLITLRPCKEAAQVFRGYFSEGGINEELMQQPKHPPILTDGLGRAAVGLLGQNKTTFGF